MTPPVLLALGGADCVWDDMERAAGMLDRFDVAAVNEAGRDYRGDLALWCSLHAEKMPGWQRARRGNQDYACICNKLRAGARIDRAVPEFWSGSSGLYVVQVAAMVFGYDRIICCGMPLTETPHFHKAHPWNDARTYQRGWREGTDQPELRGKVRSMSGFTRDLLGEPDTDWLARA